MENMKILPFFRDTWGFWVGDLQSSWVFIKIEHTKKLPSDLEGELFSKAWISPPKKPGILVTRLGGMIPSQPKPLKMNSFSGQFKSIQVSSCRKSWFLRFVGCRMPFHKAWPLLESEALWTHPETS